MRPTKLTSQLFFELPPVLAHYVKAERNLWVEGNPRRGRISMLNRTGNFVDLETLAAERRQLIETMGHERARSLRYRTGFEQGRRDGALHYETYGQNARLALQAPLVFGQLQGRFIAETIKFDFDLDARTLYRELRLESCVEAVIHRMTLAEEGTCVCWATAGYLAGNVSEILGRRSITMETECTCQGAAACRFVTRLEGEWAGEAAWVRKAMKGETFDAELARRDVLIASAQKAARRAQSSLNNMMKRMRSDLLIETIVADSEAMLPVMKRIRQLMNSPAPVLLTGEAGVGKETLGRAIHYGGPNKTKPFVIVDCLGLKGPLLAQELLGYEKGYTLGAVRSHEGAIRRADGGTLYINGIQEMDLELQGRLLRVIQDGVVTPLGAESPVKVDLRFIVSLRGEPTETLRSGALREDLYYVLSVGAVNLPPLRERTDDLLQLAETFLREFKARYDKPEVSMSQSFKQMLVDCAWPGNVRQLRNVLEHSVVAAPNRELKPEDLPEEILATRWRRPAQALTREVIQAALKRTHNNKSAAANLLGVGRTTLWRAMKRLSLE